MLYYSIVQCTVFLLYIPLRVYLHNYLSIKYSSLSSTLCLFSCTAPSLITYFQISHFSDHSRSRSIQIHTSTNPTYVHLHLFSNFQFSSVFILPFCSFFLFFFSFFFLLFLLPSLSFPLLLSLLHFCSDNNMKRSCDRCHKRKEHCLGTNPCVRCIGGDVTCTYLRVVKKTGRPRGPEQPVPRRKHSRNGCVPCRKQKKKCDETRPSCENCSRMGRQCVYRQNSSTGGKDSGATESTPVFAAVASVGPVSSDRDARMWPDDGFRAEFQALTPSTFFNTTEKMFLDLLLDKLLIEPDPNLRSPPDAGQSYEEQKLTLLASCMLNSVGIPDVEGQLLCYFINEVSQLLFADKSTPRFLGTVIPLCLVDRRVRYPILAIASSHRVNSSNMGEDEIMRDAVKYRGMAQCCLVDRNSDFFADTENVLLSICLVSIHEIFEGNLLFWNSALEKGSEIIRVRGGLQKVLRVSPLSIQLFCYLDHVSLLSTCATPHMDRTNNPYINYNGNHVEDILNCQFGFRYGISGELFKIMGNILTLAGLRSVRHQSLEHEAQFESLANLIEMKLQNWLPLDLDIADSFLLDDSVASGKRVLSSYWLALQWSSFLRLHQIREGYNRQDSRVSACLSIILRSLRAIEDTAELETGLMFPLMMAGLVCVEKSDREYILARMGRIRNKLRFNYVGEFERLLHAVWARDNVDGDAVNWARIRFFHFPGLVMF